MKYNTTKWYESIDKLQSLDNYKEIHNLWYKIFYAYCKVFNMNKGAIKSLFYNFQMQNWKDMHKSNSEYAEYLDTQLLESFKRDVAYCSDRMSLDRLFRNHWKFRQLYGSKLPYCNLKHKS